MHTLPSRLRADAREATHVSSQLDDTGSRRELIRRAKLPPDPSSWAADKRPLYIESFAACGQGEEGCSRAWKLAEHWTRKLKNGGCAESTLSTVRFYLRKYIAAGGDVDRARGLSAEAQRLARPHIAHARQREREFQRLMVETRVLIDRNRGERRPPVTPMRLTRSRESRPVVRCAQRSTGDSGDSDLSDESEPPSAAGHSCDRLRHISEALPAALEAMRPEGGPA
jgi:hypothetical protein